MKKQNLILLGSSLLTLSACNMVVDEQAGYQPNHSDIVSASPVAEAMSYEAKRQSVASAMMKREMHFSKSRKMISPAVLQYQTVSQAGIKANIQDRDSYQHFKDNGIKLVKQTPVSTFSIDVDTGSYTNVRRMVNEGRLPPENAVRVEEMLNYFSYDNNTQVDGQHPFELITETGPTPWNANTQLLRVSLKSKPLDLDQMKRNNLVFLIDVSGSMHAENKLGLLKKSLKLLARQLNKDDSVAIVVYAGASGTVLEPVAGNNLVKIEQALEQLRAGGSTNGASGIKLAYQIAKQAFIKGGNNRVILATDGDFNVGTVDHHALVDLVEQKRKQGIYLTTLGFGAGNYNDALMEQLADKGNGNYAYIDSLIEAKKVLVDEIGATLETVAKDVKIQVEFNPAVVSEYRLIGYENRQLAREDFNNDKIDAGEMGAGHSVMALYEITLAGNKGRIDPLRYSSQQNDQSDENINELAYVKLRYKPVDQESSLLHTRAVQRMDINPSLQQTSDDYRFASAVAAYGQSLRGGKHLNGFGYKSIEQLAAGARGEDLLGLRSQFLQMVGLTGALNSKISSL